MALWVKAFAMKPDNLSLIPKVHMLEGQIVLGPPHVHCAYMYNLHTHTHAH